MTVDPRTREPAALSYQLTIDFYVSDAKPTKRKRSNVDWQLLGSMDLLIWTNAAPRACQLLREYVEKDYFFAVARMIGSFKKPKSFIAFRKGKNIETSEISTQVDIDEEKLDALEKRSKLWTVPDSVSLNLRHDEPWLVIANSHEPLQGSHLEKPPGMRGEGEIVIGKVLNPPPLQVRQLQDLIYSTRTDFQAVNSTGRGVDINVTHFMFECSIIELDF